MVRGGGLKIRRMWVQNHRAAYTNWGAKGEGGGVKAKRPEGEREESQGPRPRAKKVKDPRPKAKRIQEAPAMGRGSGRVQDQGPQTKKSKGKVTTELKDLCRHISSSIAIPSPSKNGALRGCQGKGKAADAREEGRCRVQAIPWRKNGR